MTIPNIRSLDSDTCPFRDWSVTWEMQLMMGAKNVPVSYPYNPYRYLYYTLEVKDHWKKSPLELLIITPY